MPYLTRRVKYLLDQLESGQLQMVPEVYDKIIDDLRAVRVDEVGDPILESVTDRLRSYARAYFIASEGLRQSESEVPTENASLPATSAKLTSETLRELFAHFEQVFCCYTNSRPDLFTKGQDFATAIRALGRSWQNDRVFRDKTLTAGSNAMSDLLSFYKKTGLYLFHAAKQQLGAKAVLGGTQSFTPMSSDAVRSMVLYCDTTLVADPVYRWVEIQRDAEAFQFPRMLEDLLGILSLKPLVDADLPISPVIIFPSFEGFLDKNDVQTQDAQERMLMRFFGHYFNARFDDLSEIFVFARRRPLETIDAIKSSRLLVAPGATGEEDFETQLEMIRDNNRRFRSERYQEEVSRLDPSVLALSTIMDRLGPIYHMNENADELGANPLMSLPVHWHYYELLAKANREVLTKADALPADVSDVFKELTSQERCWFGNVPFEVLVDLRRRGENQDFRRKLGSALADLRASTKNNVTSSMSMVEQALRQVSVEYHKEIANLEARYKRTYTPMAIAGWLTIAASFLPYFPPITVAAGLGALAVYLGGKAQERMERVQLGRTTTGILAASARSQ